MPYNSVADSFHTKKLSSRLTSSEVRFYTEIEYRFKIGDFAPMWPVDPKFQVGLVAPTNLCSSQKTRLSVLSYCIKKWTDFSSVLSQSTRLTDGRTDRQNSHR